MISRSREVVAWVRFGHSDVGDDSGRFGHSHVGDDSERFGRSDDERRQREVELSGGRERPRHRREAPDRRRQRIAVTSPPAHVSPEGRAGTLHECGDLNGRRSVRTWPESRPPLKDAVATASGRRFLASAAAAAAAAAAVASRPSDPGDGERQPRASPRAPLYIAAVFRRPTHGPMPRLEGRNARTMAQNGRTLS